MVRYTASSALIALASAMVALGLPQPGTYQISQGEQFLSLGDKSATAELSPADKANPGSQKVRLENMPALVRARKHAI
jgi:hypothetical protein